MASKVRPVVYSTTGIEVFARASSTNLTFSANLGPIGIFVKKGTAVLDKDGDVNTVDYATFRYGVDKTTPYVELSDFLSKLKPTLEAKAGVSLPLYGPTATLPIGTPPNNKLIITVNDLKVREG